MILLGNQKPSNPKAIQSKSNPEAIQSRSQAIQSKSNPEAKQSNPKAIQKPSNPIQKQSKSNPLYSNNFFRAYKQFCEIIIKNMGIYTTFNKVPHNCLK